MDEYRYPHQEPDPAQQPRRRRRAADAAEGAMQPVPAPQQPQVAEPFPQQQPVGPEQAFRPDPVTDKASQPASSQFRPEQPWQARPGFAPEQRTMRRAPVQDPYRYTPPAQEPPKAAPRSSPRVVRPPVPEEAQLTAAPAAEPTPAGTGSAVAARQPVPAGDSYFDGKLHQLIGHAILGFLVTVLTLGLGYPWALCRQYGWRVKHTVVQGRRLTFDGKAGQLFGKWLLWLLLTIVTLGIYSLWVGISLEKWRVKHTHFAE